MTHSSHECRTSLALWRTRAADRRGNVSVTPLSRGNSSGSGGPAATPGRRRRACVSAGASAAVRCDNVVVTGRRSVGLSRTAVVPDGVSGAHPDVNTECDGSSARNTAAKCKNAGRPQTAHITRDTSTVSGRRFSQVSCESRGTVYVPMSQELFKELRADSNEPSHV